MGEKLERSKAVVRETRKVLVTWSVWDGILVWGWHYLYPLWGRGNCPSSCFSPRDRFSYSLRHLWAKFLCKLKYLASKGLIGNDEYWSSTTFFKLRAISNTVYLKTSKSNIMVISKTVLSLQVYVTSLSFTQSSIANSNKNTDISLLI